MHYSTAHSPYVNVEYNNCLFVEAVQTLLQYIQRSNTLYFIEIQLVFGSNHLFLGFQVLVRNTVQTLFHHIPSMGRHLLSLQSCCYWPQMSVLWFWKVFKKKKFLLSSSISVCNSCAEFFSEIFTGIRTYCEFSRVWLPIYSQRNARYRIRKLVRMLPREHTEKITTFLTTKSNH